MNRLQYTGLFWPATRVLSNRVKDYLNQSVPALATRGSGAEFSDMFDSLIPLAGVEVDNITMDATADTDTTITHNLGRVPAGYIVIRSSGSGVVYDGSTPADWTATTFTLRCSAASQVISVWVF